MPSSTPRPTGPVLLAALVVVATVTAVPASAQSDDQGLVGLFNGDDEDDEGVLPDELGTGISLAKGYVSDLVNDGADRTASAAAQAVQTFFNDRSTAFTTYANARTNATTEANVLELTFEREGERATVYLVADVNGSEYENASVVDSTSRTVDESCTLSNEAAANAPDELETFHSTFVEPNKSVSRAYLAGKAGRYRGEVDCSFTLKEAA